MTWIDTILQTLKQSDGVSWAIVIFLLFLSVIAWSIFFYRLLCLKSEKRNLKKILFTMKQKELTVNELSSVATTNASTTIKSLVGQTTQLLSNQVNNNKQKSIGEFITDLQWGTLQDSLYHYNDYAVQQWQSGLSFLSTVAAVAPLLGLFGTVWGLMQSFIGISTHTTDMNAMAPGIAQALVTTLVGLLVAIPAMIMFNYLSSQVRDLDHLLSKIIQKVGETTQTFVK